MFHFTDEKELLKKNFHRFCLLIYIGFLQIFSRGKTIFLLFSFYFLSLYLPTYVYPPTFTMAGRTERPFKV